MGAKLNIEAVTASFKSEGYKLITDHYDGQNTKLIYVCPNGHERSVTWKSWRKGSRCLLCANKSNIVLEDVRKMFLDDGYILLADKYINNKIKLPYICPEGHEDSITLGDWSQGHRCPHCANNKALDIGFVKSEFEKEGFTFVKGVYKNRYSVLTVVCPNGHEYNTSRNNWVSGSRCPICYNNKINIDIVKESFENEGYVLLSTEYINAKSKLLFICPNGHKKSITWAGWKRGHRCYDCWIDSRRRKFSDIKKSFENNGYILISDEKDYVNGDSKLSFICNNGHKHSMSYINWGSGQRCSYCYGNVKKEFDYVKYEIEKEGYVVLSDEPKFFNNRFKLHTVCPNGHDYYVSWFDWNSNKVRCYKCKERGTSEQEQSIIDFLKLHNIDFEVHDRYIIQPQELDIIIPSKKIAIEYCGLYWHSEFIGKGRNYHLDKLLRCNENGFRLITIFEDEWLYNRDIVESRLKHTLDLNADKRIYARKCDIKEIDTKTARLFIENNHLQGYAGSNIKLGAFFDDKLVSVMTFSKPSISKGAKNGRDYVWELNRFCSLKNYSVVGIASKFISYFKNNYKWNEIFSYADRRWSDGHVYKKLGFNYVGETPPNYWYFKSNAVKRIHRFVLRKTEQDPIGLTEWESRKNDGYNRIWDCGNFKYSIKKEQFI